MTVDIYNSYSGLCQLLICFHPESEIHYYEYQPDIISIRDFLKYPRNLISVLQDAKRILALSNFPYDAISSAINRKFDNYENDVKPWFLSVLKLLEEEAARQGIEIPEDLQGLWKDENLK